ncbi:M15 family metallopeptidase [Xylophilus sp. GOD-11R]|uniref:M15 family metallopeptidase n=1 Tax=Xylophilus sp. GOD-11R TaxID=3089814 RepID=UPI00298CC5B9|nr:M15 family metallopeptidase [Xylophilus sp. GOD-11R]WPB58828.1 M15 family metallopeptidase [Xylophilus sp. GOD-11R]
MDLDRVVREVQKKLGVEVDGKPGPQTWKAIYASVIGKPVPDTKKFAATADPRSEKTIAGLQPEVAPYARLLVARAADIGIQIKIISGLRTYAEQDALFAQGRTKPGPRVTNAKAGESNHNFGIAFDIGVFDGATYLPESAAYDAVGAVGLEIGLDWGGNWTTIKDRPHYQLRPGWAALMSEREMLEGLRARVRDSKPVFA